MNEPTTPEGGSTPDGSDSGTTIPKERLDAVLGRLRNSEAQNRDLATRIESLETPVTTTETLSRAEAVRKVEAGELTPEAAQEQLDAQTEDRILSKVGDIISTKALGSTIDTEMSGFTQRFPDLADPDSELRGRATEEMRYLVTKLGMPNNAQTELSAIRTVVGTVTAKPKLRLESHQEGFSGSSGGDDNNSNNSPSFELSPDEKRFYESVGVGEGKLYSSWDQVNKMVEKHGNKSLRAKHGARV